MCASPAASRARVERLVTSRVPMTYALLGYWIPGLGTSIGLGFFTPLGGLGIWLGLAFGLVVVATLMLQRWWRRERLGLVPAAAISC